MLSVRRTDDRGRTEWGWLDSRHTFSFGEYYDPRHMGFRSLRVVNDDRVVPGAGFGTHPHRDMEILSYVLDGALEHKDSMGSGSIIRPGELQLMSAGTGVTHSEYNPSRTEPVHFLQIWILPDRRGLTPRYEQRAFPMKESAGRLILVASKDGRDGSLTISQDVAVHAAVLRAGDRVTLPLSSGRHAWVHVARGRASVNGTELSEGDAAAVSDERQIVLEGVEAGGEAMLFDLA